MKKIIMFLVALAAFSFSPVFAYENTIDFGFRVPTAKTEFDFQAKVDADGNKFYDGKPSMFQTGVSGSYMGRFDCGFSLMGQFEIGGASLSKNYLSPALKKFLDKPYGVYITERLGVGYVFEPVKSIAIGIYGTAGVNLGFFGQMSNKTDINSLDSDCNGYNELSWIATDSVVTHAIITGEFTLGLYPVVNFRLGRVFGLFAGCNIDFSVYNRMMLVTNSKVTYADGKTSEYNHEAVYCGFSVPITVAPQLGISWRW